MEEITWVLSYVRMRILGFARNRKEITKKSEIKEKSDDGVDEIMKTQDYDYIRNHREIMWISMISKSRTLIERVSDPTNNCLRKYIVSRYLNEKYWLSSEL